MQNRVEGKVSGVTLSVLVTAAVLSLIHASWAATVAFQDGVNDYAGTTDTWIGSALPDTVNAASALVEWDGEDAGGQNYGLIRFDGIIESGAGQIPVGAMINSATLSYQVTNAGNSATVNVVLVDGITPEATWNNFGGDAGVQADEYGALVGTASGAAGMQSLDVTASVASWAVNPSLNKGWIFRPTGGTDGVEFISSNSSTVASRPKLSVTYTLLTAVDLTPDSINTVVGKANIPVTVSIPPAANSSNAVTVLVSTSDAAVVVPVGASGNTVVLMFAAGGSNQQTVALDIGQAGNATITTTNDAGLDNDSMQVVVAPGAVSTAPVFVNAGTGTTVPVKVSVTAGSNETRAVSVTLSTADAAVAVPAGATGGARTITFAAGGSSSQFVDVQCVQAGDTTVALSSDSGLSGATLPVHVFEGFNFTVTADPRTQVGRWAATLAAMQEKISSQGVFHMSPGDIDPPQPLRDAIDSCFGPAAVWYPGPGNHEVETASDMTWIRAEYQTDNGQRTALKYFTNQDGPAGTVETTFSWDYGNAHFISLNEYWNGGTAAGSDVGTDGNIVPALYDWLAADLAANTKPVVIVFGHEPAFPFNRHIGDSLDKYPDRRDAFWSLLQSYGVHAYFCGHTHFYSKYQSTPGGTWQIDVGNAGNDGGDGLTFANVIVTSTQVTYEIWRDKTGSWVKAETWSVPVGHRLIVNPESISRTVRLGSGLPNDTFTVGATGSGPIEYTVAVDGAPAWLSVHPASGVFSGTANGHEAVYSTSALAAGEYTAAIRITSPDVINSPRTIAVSVLVRPARADFDADNDVDQTDFGQLQSCLTGSPVSQTPPECMTANLNGDGVIDQGDISVFLTCFAGPDQPIPAACP